MYGLVNKAVEGLVCSRFGEAAWEQILEHAGVDERSFVSMQAYDDQVTYRLVQAAAEVLGLGADTVLEGFGEYWITYTVDEGYGTMMNSFGTSLREFLENLNDLHARISITMPELRPPSFAFTELGDSSLVVRYESTRDGLAPMVLGLLRGLVKRFGEPYEVVQTGTRANSGADFFRLAVPVVGPGGAGA